MAVTVGAPLMNRETGTRTGSAITPELHPGGTAGRTLPGGPTLVDRRSAPAADRALVDRAAVPDSVPAPAAVPLRADGTPYRFEMIHAAGTRHTYADESAELISALIPGYRGAAADPVGAAAARIAHATHLQVTVQAAINLEFGLDGCSAGQRALLCGGRSVPPAPALWTAPVPLVLVDCYYAPVGFVPRPLAEAPGEIRWLRPSTELAHLRSLADLGVIALAEHRPAPDPDPVPTQQGA